MTVDRRPSRSLPPSHTDPPNLLRSTHRRVVRPASKPWPGAALLRLPRLLAGAAANASGTLAVPRAAPARRPRIATNQHRHSTRQGPATTIMAGSAGLAGCRLRWRRGGEVAAR